MESIRNTLILDKPKYEQLRIAKILRLIDDKIDNNNHINNNLDYKIV